MTRRHLIASLPRYLYTGRYSDEGPREVRGKAANAEKEKQVIKVTIMYANEEGKTFDFDYWTGTHGPMVQRLLSPMGMVKSELEKGVSDTDPNAPPRFIAVGNLYFSSTDEVHESFKNHGREIMGDIKNYTEIQPTFLISETLG